MAVSVCSAIAHNRALGLLVLIGALGHARPQQPHQDPMGNATSTAASARVESSCHMIAKSTTSDSVDVKTGRSTAMTSWTRSRCRR